MGTHANAGGVLVAGDDDCTRPTSGCVRATVRNSIVSDNIAAATSTGGDATAFGGGINVDGVLALDGSTIGHNRVRAKVPAGSTAAAFGDSAGIGMGGYASISNSRLVGNSVTAQSPGGMASAMFAALSVGNGAFTTTLSHTVISSNHLAATTTSGTVVLQGAGIGHLNSAPLVLRRTSVKRNIATGAGPNEIAQGGGIWNGRLDPSSRVGPLRLIGTTITANALRVAPGIAAQGGGVFTVRPLAIRHSTISHNRPDQCHGC